MEHQEKSKITQIIKKGVRIVCPESVEIGNDVDVDKISGQGVVIHAGSKILGDKTLILRDAKIGFEGPATLKNCQIGPEVELKGGYFEDAVFLAKAKAGLGSHVREASIFEEQASVAHSVGTKHTILFPFVTLGSVINFCDCLMAGGTSRKNHSEVGSSYIHFNFTPNQDKATASLIGDVPKGVMLDQSPIFLGGQGGLVGPCRLAYGTTVAAGTIVRKDELREGRLLIGGTVKENNLAWSSGRYANQKRVVVNNLIYIANLLALNQWYQHVRSLFISKDFPEWLLTGVREKLNLAITERLRRLEALGNNMQSNMQIKKSTKSKRVSAAVLQAQELFQRWSDLKGVFEQLKGDEGDTSNRNLFLEKIDEGIAKKGRDYLTVIQALVSTDAAIGTQWLQGIVDRVVAAALNLIPSYK